MSSLPARIDLARSLYREQVPVATIARHPEIHRSPAWVCAVATGRLHADLGTEPLCAPRGPTGPNAEPRPRGSKAPNRSLSPALVREYLEFRHGAGDMPRATLAAALGIHPQTAYRIDAGQAYRDVVKEVEAANV